MKKYIKTLKPSELIVAIHIIAVLFGLPLITRNGYFDIGVVKYYFYCGTAVILVPVLFLALLSRPSISQFFKTLSTAEKALIIYWVVAVLSTLFSHYKYESFWGNEGRFSGLFLMSIYTIAYFVISRHYKPHPWILYSGLISGAIVFLLGITDFFNLNLLHFKDDLIAEHYPIFMSTIGNINFYSGYGVMILGLAVGLYVSWNKITGTTIYFLLLILSFIGLIVGNSDNAYLAFGALLAFLPLRLFCDRKGLRRYMMAVSALLLSFMAVKLCDIYFSDIILTPDGIRTVLDKWNGFNYVCAVFWLLTVAVYIFDYTRHKQEESLGSWFRIAWGIFLVIAALAVIAVLIDANLLGNSERYGSIKNYVVFNNDWGTHRGYAWRKAVENYIKFPILQKILGHGPDTYGIVSMFNDVVESSKLYGELFDSVHNEYLQFFVTIGPIGAISYMVFLALSIKDMLKSNSPFVTGIVFAVLFYCVQAVVSINQPTSTPILWTLLAIGIAECRKSDITDLSDYTISEKG